MAETDISGPNRGVAPQSIPDSDRPDAYAVKTVWASALGYALEAFDNFILSFCLVAITATFALTGPEAGALATITILGAVVGGFAFGILSDYFGRVRVLTWTILTFAILTAVSALAQNYTEFALLRFAAGMGIGGEYGIGMALVSEGWPKAWRARATSFVALGSQAGLLIALLVSTIVLNFAGWRVIFAIGIFPAVFAYWYRRAIPEPALFEQKKRQRQRFPLTYLFKDAQTTRRSVGIIVLTSVQNFGYYGVIVFLPTYLSKQLGMSVTKTGAWTAATVIGFSLGMVIFGLLADRIGRKPTFITFMVGAIVSLLLYSQLSSQIALLVGGAFMGIFVNGMLGGYGALTAELFPTEARGTAQNVLYNIGRGIGAFAPLVVGAIAEHYSFPLALGLVGLTYILDIIAITVLIPETKGAALT
jgi:MFS family permease